MWFKKIKERIIQTEIDLCSAKRKIQLLEKANKNLCSEVDKMGRIIRYSSSEPTYHIERDLRLNMSVAIYYTVLYLYVDRNEYVFTLNELSNMYLDETTVEFSVDDNYAYFNISASPSCNSDEITKHDFIIDYKHNKYIHSEKPIDNIKTEEKDDIKNDNQ